MNPAPAAAFLLRMSTRRPTLWSQGAARRRLTRRRTRTNNPFPAALALATKLPFLSSLPGIGGIAKRFRKPSEQRAAAVAPQLVQSANSGNLTAARAIHDRTTFGIAKERAVWLSALGQVSPPIMTEALRNPSVPSVDHSTPESAASSALANAFYGAGVATAGPAGGIRVQQSALPVGLQIAGALTGGAAPRARARGTARTPAGPPAGDPSTWTKAQRRKWGLTVAKVKRWNPDTERSESVWADSPEARSWPTVAQGKRALQSQRRLGQTAARIGGTLAAAAPAAGSAVLAAGSAAGLGAAATLGAVGAAFGVGYAIGSGINALVAYLSPDQVNERKALAFRQARKDWAAQHGRPMTAQEVRDMGAGFKQATAEYRAQIGSQR